MADYGENHGKYVEAITKLSNKRLKKNDSNNSSPDNENLNESVSQNENESPEVLSNESDDGDDGDDDVNFSSNFDKVKNNLEVKRIMKSLKRNFRRITKDEKGIIISLFEIAKTCHNTARTLLIGDAEAISIVFSMLIL